MKILKLLTLAALFLTSSAFARDPFVGEYMGKFENDIFKGNPSLFARVSRHAGTYKVEILPALAQRAEAYAEVSLEGFVDKDEIAFEMGNSTKFSGKITKDGVLSAKVSRGGKVGEFALKKFERGSPSMGKKAPKGSIVLFDGTSLDEWVNQADGSPCKWNILKDEKAMEIRLIPQEKGKKRVYTTAQTKRKFKDFKMHLEFFIPEEYALIQPKYTGNSGLYIGDVEIQIIDSFAWSGSWSDCGAIYRASPPRVNASLPPDRWQTYDVIYKAPRFDDNGKIKSYPSFTVIHNGIVIQRKVLVKHGTSHMETLASAAVFKEEAQAISLQDHGSPVKFRNIWLLEEK